MILWALALIAHLAVEPAQCVATMERPCALSGKVKFVESNADYKVRFTRSGLADARVRYVRSFPSSAGQWQVVESFPNFTVEVVDSFADFTVKLVQSGEGCQ